MSLPTPTRLPDFSNLALPLAISCDASRTVIDADGTDVLVVNPLGEFGDAAEPALARLFAAAPDLLLAAEAFVAPIDGDWNLGDGDRERLIALRAAIAKARGHEVARG